MDDAHRDTDGTAPAGPLSGIRILDFSTAVSGPLATALLADQGAAVTKIERPGLGDLARYVGPSVNGMSAIFVQSGRGKRSVVLDIATAAGRDVALRLCAGVDVVTENFRPGVMERLGLGYDDVAAVNPDVVYASVSGYGSNGPYADRKAYDLAIQAYAGCATTQADPADGRPALIRQTAADKITALTVSQAVTAALLARERGAGGQHVEVSMMDAVTSFVWIDSAGNEILVDSDGSSPSELMGAFAPFPLLDGWAVVAPVSDDDFAGMCRAFGFEDRIDDDVRTIAARFANREKTALIFDECLSSASTMTQAEVSERLGRHSVPFALVLSPSQLIADRHAVQAALFEERDHHIAGRTRIPRHPCRFSRTPARLSDNAPSLGEHTVDVLTEAGLADSIEALREERVIG